MILSLLAEGPLFLHEQSARTNIARASRADTQTVQLDGRVAVVKINGTLFQRAWESWWWGSYDGYDAIVQRIQTALASAQVDAVVLQIDSPGGFVAGCFDAVRAIRTSALTVDKPIVAFADEMACSAAYALASSASKIVVPSTGVLGSIGVVRAVYDQSKMLSDWGLAVHLITSGKAKADGHPAIPLSDEARARMQSEVDQLADIFAAEVAATRPLEQKAIRGLEAQTFIGQRAIDAGLADQQGTLIDAIALAASLGKTKREKRNMKAIIAVLGLSANSSETDVCNVVQDLQKDRTKLLGASGSATVDEAVGKTTAWQSKASLYDADKVKRDQEAAERVERERKEAEARKQAEHAAVVKEGVSAGKLTTFQVQNWCPTQSAESLRSFLAHAPVVVFKEQTAHKEQAATKASGAVTTADGKRWEDLSNNEKIHLSSTDKATYEALLADADKRGVR